MGNDLNDWNINPDPETLAYHLRQWDEPYRSTVAFAEFARPWLEKSRHVLDLGCGGGGATTYLARQFERSQFLGLDISDALIKQAWKREGPPNLSFSICDMCNTGALYTDGVISLQTFSWMPDIETPLDQICKKIAPKWMAFSSLFYEGDISCKIEVDEPKRPRKSYYNIYSIPRTEAFLKERGYIQVGKEEFEIDKDLPVGNPDFMHTTTWITEGGYRVQQSGPLLLPWYFLAFERTGS